MVLGLDPATLEGYPFSQCRNSLFTLFGIFTSGKVQGREF